MPPEDENVVFLAVATLVCCIAAFALVMIRQLKQAACPSPPQVSTLDRRSELKGGMTAAHPDSELAEPGHRAIEYYARH
jgi:hypothetical protein